MHLLDSEPYANVCPKRKMKVSWKRELSAAVGRIVLSTSLLQNVP